MSTLYSEDICAFKADPAIVGTIEHTWSEVDVDLSLGLTNCYIYKDLPPRVRKAWFEDERLSPGYVIIAFLQQCDGYCLVHESSLSLIDRSLAVGDTVKKFPSDAQSGTIISTSLLCTLQPLCDEAEYNRQQRPLPQGHIPSHGPHVPKHKSQREGLRHGFPEPQSPTRPLGYSPWAVTQSSPTLKVPAQELRFWNAYREEDSIIFDNWVGQVEAVYDEVTVRLSNGSVVVVEDPEELEEPYWIPGTSSYELAQRLDRAGFYQYWPRKSHPGIGKPRTGLAEPCYPGQYVQTKKGNLRCGRWKFGAYDPTVPPRGIVVDVRCTELEVRWLYPNQSLPLRDQVEPPPGLLGVDELESGRVIVYDRSKLPRHSTADQLPNASYSRDTGFGHKMRFRDPAGAAIKYSHSAINLENADSVSNSSYFHRIPRSATQGFDMNVLQVTSTSTTAMVRWQDCTVTVEKAIDIKPYLNPDEHDVWPGDKVSYIPEEAPVDDNTPAVIRIRKVGVVQCVDAAGRIANVRWFKDAEIVMNEGRIWNGSQSNYGEIGDEITEVSLYDIAAHPALVASRGDGAIIIPDSAFPVGDQDSSSGLLAAGIERARGIFELGGGAFGANVTSRNLIDGAIPPTVPPTDGPGSPGIDWCGEIIDLCLDGQLLIRLGAAAEVQEIKSPPGRILVVPSEDQDDDSDWTDDEDEESGWTDEMSLDESESDPDNDHTIDVSVEYEGGENLDGDADGAMWTTDEEANDDTDTHKEKISSITPAIRTIRPNVTLERPDRAISFKDYSTMPEQFAILGGAPDDHHFTSTSRPLTANLMRRIAKENGIIQQSLPDGVFVRTWESRVDLLRVLIVGPHDTPYEFAPFIFDLQYGAQFPTSPPSAFFHSWTGNLGRVNPNLYEDGTICLSLLGTWNADKHNEAWSSKDSTVLQLIVSLMGLVLVKEPYYSKSCPNISEYCSFDEHDDLSAFGSSLLNQQVLSSLYEVKYQLPYQHTSALLTPYRRWYHFLISLVCR